MLHCYGLMWFKANFYMQNLKARLKDSPVFAEHILAFLETMVKTGLDISAKAKMVWKSAVESKTLDIILNNERFAKHWAKDSNVIACVYQLHNTS